MPEIRPSELLLPHKGVTLGGVGIALGVATYWGLQYWHCSLVPGARCLAAVGEISAPGKSKTGPKVQFFLCLAQS